MSFDLLGAPFPALASWLDDLGVGARHAPRVFRGLHRDRVPLDAVPDLGRHAAVIAAASVRAQVDVAARHPAADGNVRLVFGLHDGARVEGVLLPTRGSDRVTLCLSSQVGCAMACAFCATGTLGLTRDLTAGEIVGQVHAARRELEGTGRRLSRLVFMGMGEPLHAYDSLRDALRVLMDPHGEALGGRQMTVSTVGLVRRLEQLRADFGGRVQLALSLHAGTDATRLRIIPTARRYPLDAIKAELAAFPKNRPVMLEYVLLPGVNDTDAEWDGVAAFAAGLPAIVNLIPFNPFPGAGFVSPDEAAIRAAYAALKARGVTASIRWPRGREQQAACGQLMLAGGAPASA